VYGLLLKEKRSIISDRGKERIIEDFMKAAIDVTKDPQKKEKM
jgi:hypothetical protein